MEEPASNDSKTPVQPPTGRFMDIQSPSGSATDQTSQVTITPDGKLTEGAEGSPAEAAAPAETPSAPVSVPVNEAAAEPEAAASEPSQPPADAPLPSEQPAPSDQPPAKPKAHNAPVVAILFAIIVTLALCGLVIFAYVKSKNKAPISTKNTPATSQEPVAKPQASPADIDQVSSDIDKSLDSLDDAADFSANSISDQALGIQ